MSFERITTIMFATLTACSAPTREQSDASSLDSASDSASDVAIDTPLVPVECPQGAELVYTIDKDGRIYRFDPTTKAFTQLGVPCTTSPGVGPTSMSVDRYGWAWIRYADGKLFKIPLSSVGTVPNVCQELPFTPPPDLSVYGMGFSTDTIGGSTEALHISGCDTLFSPISCGLARVDPTTLALTRIGETSYAAEMTGNQNAELWGFLPGTTARVVRFDKTTGVEAQSFRLPELDYHVEGWAAPYAFAHWGGHYWVFLEYESLYTDVYELDPSTGTIVSTTSTQGRTIVGAGVSTCAPTIIL